MSHFERVSQGIGGRLAMDEPDAAILQEYAGLCKTWCEIGTLWGGSAILAALANPKLKATTIDSFDGLERDNPKPADVKRNLIAFDVIDRVTVCQCKSAEYLWHAFDGIFVDGSHEEDALRVDMEIAKRHAKKYILFHDIDDPIVSRTLDTYMADWKIVAESARIRVYEVAP